jgi:ABC-type multidrug transport system ATPase subunit
MQHSSSCLRPFAPAPAHKQHDRLSSHSLSALPAAQVTRALEVADLLLLRKSLDSLVGTQLIKGISGGEKRRLSLGMQMITNPSILFLDEPTSG